ncbi:MAG: hypothetical protein Q8K12_16585 [Thiobacillus sp.]|nr:hypothetical protein [Thiobacillus sp.]
MKLAWLGFALMAAAPLHADELPVWNTEQPPEAVSHLAEPASDEVVVVINDNALGGNHTGLFAGKLLIDPAGSYVGVRTEDKDWSAPTLADYARYQTADGPNIRLYRFSLQAQAFAAIVQRIHSAGATPPLFCASAVQNLLAGILPFEAIEPTGWTSPSALGHLLDRMTQGESAAGECQKLDATPC